jgi:hypothetical protein
MVVLYHMINMNASLLSERRPLFDRFRLHVHNPSFRMITNVFASSIGVDVSLNGSLEPTIQTPR